MNNTKTLIAGTVVEGFIFSHEVYDEKFFKGYVAVKRASGTEDIIPVIVSEHLFDENLDYSGKFIYITGEFRSRNIHVGTKISLDLFVFASSVEEPVAAADLNSVSLEGYICKAPVFRLTPFGREICDLMVAVNGSFGRSYYIPCICWGRDARYAEGFSIGVKVRIFGRIQSREYQKTLADGSCENRVVYEVSAGKIQLTESEKRRQEERQ